MPKIKTDQEAIDAIATMLGTSPEWDSEFLEYIADVIGNVRPHPGDSAKTYRWDFRSATGRDVPEDYVSEDLEEGEEY